MTTSYNASINCTCIFCGVNNRTNATAWNTISWCLQVPRFRFRLFQSLWNLTEASAAMRPRPSDTFPSDDEFLLPNLTASKLRFVRTYNTTSYRLVNNRINYKTGLAAPSHYLNQRLLASVRFRDIHLWGISQKIAQQSVADITLKIVHLKFHSNLPGASGIKRSSEIPH